ncbi:MAG: hypothetical protein ACFE8E_06195 [Candidatus Hodarchaeota archaeon]
MKRGYKVLIFFVVIVIISFIVGFIITNIIASNICGFGDPSCTEQAVGELYLVVFGWTFLVLLIIFCVAVLIWYLEYK